MNRTNFGILSLFLSLLLSCSSVTEELVSLKTEAAPRIPVNFQINLSEEILPLSGTKAMPTLTVPEPTSKAGEGESSDTDPSTPDIATTEYYQYLEYIVYKDDSPTPLKRTQFPYPTGGADAVGHVSCLIVKLCSLQRSGGVIFIDNVFQVLVILSCRDVGRRGFRIRRFTLARFRGRLWHS